MVKKQKQANAKEGLGLTVSAIAISCALCLCFESRLSSLQVSKSQISFVNLKQEIRVLKPTFTFKFNIGAESTIHPLIIY